MCRCVADTGKRFNSQPREGGWFVHRLPWPDIAPVSTRSHAKAAGFSSRRQAPSQYVSTRSHAKAAGRRPRKPCWMTPFQLAATRRRLGMPNAPVVLITPVFQLAATRRRLVRRKENSGARIRFQLAATRRRLGMFGLGLYIYAGVSTRSHAKAAGHWRCRYNALLSFQLAATRRRLANMFIRNLERNMFQLAATRRRLVM